MAYGVNLAPAAALLPKLRRLARDNEDDRARWKFLRTRIAACRANLLSAVSTALKNGALDHTEVRAWQNLVAEAIGSIRPHTPLSALERRLRELDHLDAALQGDLADDVDDTTKDGESLDLDTAEAEGSSPRSSGPPSRSTATAPGSGCLRPVPRQVN